MSADNGIYILETKGPEFRVIHAQNIDEIYGEFSDESYQWQGDPQRMVDFFGRAKVFDTAEKALDFAALLSYDYDYLEYGICMIDTFQDWDFNNLMKNYGKAKQDDQST